MRDAGPLVAGRAASAAAGLVVPVLLARILVQSEFGSYKQLFLVATTAYGLLNFGMYQSLYYFLPREPANARPFLAQAMGYLTALGFAVALGLLLLAHPLAGWMHDPELARCALPLALYAGFYSASIPLEHGLIARGRIASGGLAYVVSEGLRVLVQVGAAKLYGSVFALMWASAAFAAARALLAWTINVWALRPSPGQPPGQRFSRELFRRQWGYCLPFGAAAILMIPQQSFHMYAVSAMFDPAAFALYAVGCLQLPIVDLLYTPMSDLMILSIGNAERTGRLGEGARSFRETAAKLSFVFFPAAALLAALARPFLDWIFTSRYGGAAGIFRISVVALPLAAFPVEGVLRAMARKRFFFWAQVARLGLTAVLVLLGIHLLGLRGAILGHVLAQAAVTALLLWESARALRTPLGELLPWRQLAQNAAAGSAAGLAAFLLVRHVAARPFAQFALGTSAFTAVWAATTLLAWSTSRQPALARPAPAS
ncbi:MAG: lipopolysaccharide biosynthesis protein [Deltaproteobacteria bacterium]